MEGRTVKPITIVSCGGAKLDHPALAGEMYTGSYFRTCYHTALELTPGRVFILSALHGLIRPWHKIAPYDLAMGAEGSVTAQMVAAQAQAQGVLCAPVVALCGARYATLVDAVWADVARPLEGLGIGQQRHRMAHMRRGEIDCFSCRRWAVAGSERRPGRRREPARATGAQDR